MPIKREASIISRQVDLSDYQWRDFRGNLPLLTAMLAAFVVLSRTARRVGLLLQFYLAASTVFVFYTYGAQALFMLALALLNYVILYALLRGPLTAATQTKGK